MKKFKYGRIKAYFIWNIIGCGLLAYLCAYGAINDWSFNIRSSFHTYIGNAAFYIWTFSACFMAVFSILGLYAIIQMRLSNIKYIRFDQTSIIIPKLLLSAHKEISFKDILRLEEFKISGNTYVLLIKTTSTKVAIYSQHLETLEEYREICDVIFKVAPSHAHKFSQYIKKSP